MEAAKADIKELISELRPWAEFVGPMSMPIWSKKDVTRRLSANLQFFKTNYALIVFIFSLLYLATSPPLLLILVICSLMYLGIYLSRRKTYVFFNGAITLNTSAKLVIAAIFSIVMLVWRGYLFVLQSTFSIAGLFCMVHALLRPPVARALVQLNSASGGLSQARSTDLEGGDIVPGLGIDFDDPRNMPANANVRLRSRPYAPQTVHSTDQVSSSNFHIKTEKKH